MALSRQREDGSFQERGDMGPFTTALALVSLHSVLHLSESELAEGCRFLGSVQRTDGSFVGRPFAEEGDLATTAVAWAALSLSKREPAVLAATRARAFVETHGGVPAVVALASSGDISGYVLAMAGLLDARALPSMPVSTVLVPKLFEWLSHRVVFYGLTTLLSCALIARGLETPKAPSPRAFLRGLVADRENARAIELLTLYQNRNGSLMNVVYHTALLIPALRAAGLPDGDPRLSSAIQWLKSRAAHGPEGTHFDVYGSDVWSTASYLRVLLATGSSRVDRPIVASIEWLLGQQCKRPHPELTHRLTGAPRTGGWGFQSGEDGYPDCDTTSTVLDALAFALMPDSEHAPPLAPHLAARVCAAIADARAWLLAMQNEDGGWPSFFRGHPEKRPGPIMLRPMSLRFSDLPRNDPSAWIRAIAECSEHLGDPSTEDVTARVLLSLARSGTRESAREAQRALAFLARQQCPTGAFWGRWKVNYLPVTACVISALAAIGDDPRSDVARRAMQWVLEHQNADGGFGETMDSYRDPSLAGTGPSTAPLTGSVLIGLCDGGAATTSAAQRAAAYLLAHQADDGAWPNGDNVATLVPPNLFYEYGGACRYIPLEALGKLRARLREEARS